MARERFETKIIVREARAVHSGTNNGKPYTIYQLTATKPDGSPIEGWQLRSFFDPPKNEVLEVQCELFRSERFGDSYTVTRKSRPAVSAGDLESIRKRLDRIEQRLGLPPLEAEPPMPPDKSSTPETIRQHPPVVAQASDPGNVPPPPSTPPVPSPPIPVHPPTSPTTPTPAGDPTPTPGSQFGDDIPF